MPAAPHPVNPARPRPLPAPRPNPPRPVHPRPARVPFWFFAAALLLATALSIAGGVSLIVGWFARSVDTWNAPSDYTADLLLVPLVSLHVLVSLALKPKRRKAATR